VKNWEFGKPNNLNAKNGYPYLNRASATPAITNFGVHPPFRQVGGTWEYSWTGTPVVRYLGGAAQNNLNPYASFPTHSIVEIDNSFYDPSYGNMYSITLKNATQKQIDNAFLMQFQAKSIAGFYWITDPGKTFANVKTIQYLFKKTNGLGISFL
jgi:hypothetical protein